MALRADLVRKSQGAPRTCRCIETVPARMATVRVMSQGAPRTCRCIETCPELDAAVGAARVREHHAPVGALRRRAAPAGGPGAYESGSTTHL